MLGSLKYSLAVLTGTLVGLPAYSAYATTIDVSTGIQPWTVSGGDATGALAIPIAPNPGWIPPIPVSSWVGPNAASALVGDLPGDYTYLLDVGPLTDGAYVLTGSASSDNSIVSATVSGAGLTTIDLNLSPEIPGYGANPGPYQSTDYGFTTAFDFSSNVPGSPAADVFLTFVVNNQLIEPGGLDEVNPTGFDLSGTLTSVPLPSAAALGCSLLAGFSLFQVLRRRLICLSQIA